MALGPVSRTAHEQDLRHPFPRRPRSRGRARSLARSALASAARNDLCGRGLGRRARAAGAHAAHGARAAQIDLGPATAEAGGARSPWRRRPVQQRTHRRPGTGPGRPHVLPRSTHVRSENACHARRLHRHGSASRLEIPRRWRIQTRGGDEFRPAASSNPQNHPSSLHETTSNERRRR